MYSYVFFHVIISIVLSLIGFIFCHSLISSSKKLFINAGLHGKDLNKLGQPKIPEAVGVVAAAVYMITMFLFIPVPFFSRYLYDPLSVNCEIIREILPYLAALLAICCMVFLGFADDVLNLRWREKLLLPAIASLPILMVYLLSSGSTWVSLPNFKYLCDIFEIRWCPNGQAINFHAFFYLYILSLAVFCTNAINILAGVNGLEVGQSIVIGFSVLLLNLHQIYYGEALEHHLFSFSMCSPFLAVSIALLINNWYPAKIFVGDTYCNFAGMVLAVVGILGHFSKTLILLFIPQIINFSLSLPQLFGIIPCPRHRMPSLNTSTGLLELSYSGPFLISNLSLYGKFLFKFATYLGIVQVRCIKEKNTNIVEISNLTLINLNLIIFGPQYEKKITIIVLIEQIVCSFIVIVIRFYMV